MIEKLNYPLIGLPAAELIAALAELDTLPTEHL
jgi:hypothetical protein